jgi:hypothetical protein
MKRKGLAPLVVLFILAGFLTLGTVGYFYYSRGTAQRNDLVPTTPASIFAVSTSSISSTPTTSSTIPATQQTSTILSISFISPNSGDTVSGTVKVVVSVSGGDLIKRVDLVRDGEVIGTATSSPYAFVWNTAKDFNGAHSLSAFAFCSSDTNGWFKNMNLATNYNGAYYLQNFGICNMYSKVSINVISNIPAPPPPPPEPPWGGIQ